MKGSSSAKPINGTIWLYSKILDPLLMHNDNFTLNDEKSGKIANERF